MSKSSAAAMVRGAGMAADVWRKLDRAVRSKGGTEDALHRLARDEGSALIEVFADLLVEAELETQNRFPITVNYAYSLEEMIVAGMYNHESPNITAKNFPIEGKGTADVEIVLVHALREINALGLKPAKIEHCLAFGAKYPDVQCKFPIAFLGSSLADSACHRDVPSLGGQFRNRSLGLYHCVMGRSDNLRFAAVRTKKTLDA